MAISIDWGTKIIYVPKEDTTLIQSSPTEIRELNLNNFRLALKELEYTEEGMAHLDTHIHNTEVTLGGLTFARVVQIINDYTVTFEDGQYAVNLVGANSNVGDNINVNQVSVRSQNSAGLISSPAIEHSSYQDGVTIDLTSSYVGTIWPIGTPMQPVNNLTDAKLIAETRGLSRLYPLGNITFTADDVIDGFIIVGQNPIKTHITLEEGISSIGCEFREATINGYLSGNAYIRNCTVEALTYVEGRIIDCTLVDVITLAGETTTNIIDCRDGIAGDGKPIIDMGGEGQALTITGYNGEIALRNKNGDDKVSIDLASGEVELQSTITNGEIYVRGTGNLVDYSSGSAVIHWSALLSRDVYEDTIYVNVSEGAAGTQLPLGTQRYPVNNMEDAKVICEKMKIYRIVIHGNVTLESSFSGFKLEAPYLSSTVININGQDITGSVLKGISITGIASGKFQAIDSYFLSGMTGINATLENCILSGTFSLSSGALLNLNRCNFAGSATVFDLTNVSQLSFADITGIFTIANMSSAYSIAAITGQMICNLAASCTAGTVFITGNGILNNLSEGTTVSNTLISPSAVWEEPLSSHVTNNTVGAALNKIKTWVNYLRSTL